MNKTWGGQFKEFGDNTLEGLSANIGTFASATLEELLEREALPKLREFIESDVYSYKGNWGTRTYEFEKAWKVRRINKGFFDTIEIFIDDGEITYNWDYERNEIGQLASHSISKISDLANIINNGMSYQPPMNFPKMQPRPFWDDFLEWMENEFPKIFQAECKKYGVNMVIGGGSKITIDR